MMYRRVVFACRAAWLLWYVVDFLQFGFTVVWLFDFLLLRS